ncbi:MAG: hypothetical protein IKD66_03390, partial [Solobacterium sp.]|nr:hypothetical protein [Solobacterium sp.]
CSSGIHCIELFSYRLFYHTLWKPLSDRSTRNGTETAEKATFPDEKKNGFDIDAGDLILH